MSEPVDAATAGIGALIAVLTGGAYRFFRMIKGDARADRVDAAADRLLQEIQEENAALRERADKFAAERNAALVHAAKLEAQYAAALAEIARRDKEKEPTP